MSSSSPTVLWDLDGTLVRFYERTFKVLMPLAAAHAFSDVLAPWQFLTVLRSVLPEVRANKTSMTNHTLLCERVAACTNLSATDVDAHMKRLAVDTFPKLRRCFAPEPAATLLVSRLATAGCRQVVATNPLWPLPTVLDRLTWGGLDANRFAFITHGEAMTRSKPSVAFYEELLDKINATPSECVLVGNHPGKDGAAAQAGIPTFILDKRAHHRTSPPGPANPHAGIQAAPVIFGSWPNLTAFFEGAALLEAPHWQTYTDPQQRKDPPCSSS